jgi:YfiH family protein
MSPPIPLIQPLHLASGVWIAMTMRAGGISKPPYDTLNLGFHVGDDPGAVAENRRRAAVALEVPGGRATFGQQVHGARVALVGSGDAGRGWEGAGSALPATDALLTGAREVTLGILVADCFPVAVWDRQAGALGVAHCGWRGLAEELPGRLVEAMAQQLDAVPERCSAWIGAGIGACCFQVGAEVLDRLPGAPARPDHAGRWRLDLAALLRRQLEQAGLPSRAIETAGHCTACESGRFFSHRQATRRGEPVTGRQALFAWLE